MNEMARLAKIEASTCERLSSLARPRSEVEEEIDLALGRSPPSAQRTELVHVFMDRDDFDADQSDRYSSDSCSDNPSSNEVVDDDDYDDEVDGDDQDDEAAYDDVDEPSHTSRSASDYDTDSDYDDDSGEIFPQIIN